MAYYLAQELKKHCHNDRFTNRLTDEKYSFSRVNDELGFTPGSGYFSRVMKGKRGLSSEQVELFCQLLYLSPEEHKALEVARRKDEAQKSSFKIDRFLIQEFENFLQREAELVRILRIGGKPEEAIVQTGISLDKLKRIQNDPSLLGLSHELELFRGKLLYEKALAYREIGLSREASNETKKAVLILRDIRDITGNQEYSGQAEFSLGDLYYLMGDYQIAYSQFDRALPNLGANGQLIAVRGMIKCCANLNQPNKYHEVKRKALRLLYEGRFSRPDIEFAVREGFAGAELKLQLSTAEESLKQAQFFYDQQKSSVDKVPIRRVQFGCTRLQFLIRSISDIRRDFETLANSILDIALLCGYKRHQQEIEILKKKYL